MSKNELFSDKMAKLIKPFAALALIALVLIEYMLIDLIFFRKRDVAVYSESAISFGTMTAVGSFLFVSLMIIGLLAYFFKKGKK